LILNISADYTKLGCLLPVEGTIIIYELLSRSNISISEKTYHPATIESQIFISAIGSLGMIQKPTHITCMLCVDKVPSISGKAKRRIFEKIGLPDRHI
jgi:hypothetical protein